MSQNCSDLTIIHRNKQALIGGMVHSWIGTVKSREYKLGIAE